LSCCLFFFSSRRRHTRCYRDWSSDVCSSDLREVTLEDEIPAVLDLGDGVEPRQVYLAAFLLGELRPQNQCPVIEPFADDLRAEPVGRGLESRDVLDGEKGIVVLVEAESRLAE